MARMFCRHPIQRLLRIGIMLAAAAYTMAPARATAQQVKPRFMIHLETLPLQQQEELRNFSRDLTDYVESFEWIDEALPEPVQLHMEAFLSYQGSVIKTRYASKLTVSNGLDIKYLDRFWYFEYERDDMLRHDDRNFHSLTWLIDYYAYLMIGHELDKYVELGGTEAFERAKAICVEGRFSPEFQRGWDERLERVEEVLSEGYRPFRRARAMLYRASRLHKDNNVAEASLLGRQIVDLLASQYERNRKDERLKTFFSAHYLKLADLLSAETAPEVYEKLKRIDPDHRSTYDEYIARIRRR